jgi:hypothetical protein
MRLPDDCNLPLLAGKRWAWPGLAALMIVAGCATQPPGSAGDPAFLLGLFHGFTAIAALIGSLFFRIRIYAFPNGGFWYDAGFVTGFGASVLLLVLVSIARIGGFVTREGS